MKTIAIGLGILIGTAMTSWTYGQCGRCPEDTTAATKGAKEKAENSTDVIVQAMCPIHGRTIDKAMYVDFDGKRIDACGKECVERVAENPAEYVKKLEAQGVTLAKVQTTCPVMGGTIDRRFFVDHKGKRLYLCCAGCVAVAKENPEKYIKKAESGGVALDPAGQGAECSKEKKSHGGHKECRH